MRFNGKWLACDDEVSRPVIDGALFDPDGNVLTFPFLIDTGADSTLLSFEAVAFIDADLEDATGPLLKGVGGSTDSVRLDARFWFLNSIGEPIPLGGSLLGRPYPSGDEMCILGRDLLGNFAIIVDRPGNVVSLIQGKHHYVIHES